MNDPDTSRAALREAAEWWMQRSHRKVDRLKFEFWLRSSDRNRVAYASVERAWAKVGSARDNGSLEAQRFEALQYRAPKVFEWQRYAASVAALVFAVGVCLAIAGFSNFSLPGLKSEGAQQIFAADNGERSTITLTDGTVVTLNSGSRVAIAMAPNARQAKLLEGEAIFEVTHDSQHPFIVETGNYKITVLGTVFNVRKDRDSTEVTLAKGRVRIREEAASTGFHKSVTLRPGQQAIGTADAITVAEVNAVDLMMWREGRVRFRETPISEAVAEMARYTRIPIEAGDLGAADYLVSGTFRTSNVQGFLDAITEAFPVETSSDGRKIVIRRRKAEK